MTNTNKTITLFLVFFLTTTFLIAQNPRFIVQRGHTAPITDAVVSKKNNLIVTTSYDKSVKIWDYSTGKELMSYENMYVGFSPIKLALSADEQYLFIVKGAKNYDKIDLENFNGSFSNKETEQFVSLATNKSNNDIAIAQYNSGLWKTNYINKKDRPSFELKLDDSEVKKIAYTNDGNWLYALTDKGYLYRINTKTAAVEFPHEDKQIIDFSLHPDNSEVLILGKDSSLVYNAELNGKTIPAQTIALSVQRIDWLNPNEVLIMDNDFQLHRFSFDNLQLKPVPLFLPRFYTFKVLGNNEILYNQGPMTKVVNLDDIRNPKTFKGYVGNVYQSNVEATLFSPNNRNIVTGGGTQTIQFWGEVNTQNIEVGFPILKMKWSKDGKRLACIGEKKSWKLIDAEQKTVEYTFEGHTKAITDVTFINDKLVATSSRDKTIIIWNIQTKEQILQLKGHQGYINGIASFGDRIASGDDKGNIIVWDKATGQILSEYESKQKGIYTLLFSPNGTELLTGRDDGSLLILDWKNQTPIDTLTPFSKPITDLKYISSNEIAISSRLSDRKTGSPILSLKKIRGEWRIEKFVDTKGNGVNNFNVSSNSKFIISGGGDNKIKIWSGYNGKLLATIFNLGNNEWAMVTPEGLFDASPNGMLLMHYAYKTETIELSQLKERYYEPDLLQKILGYNDEPIRDVKSFSRVELYPKADVSLNKLKLNIELTKRNGGIGKVSVFINNKEIIEDANTAQQTLVSVDLNNYKKYFLNDTMNTIGVKVFNNGGWLHSRMHTIDYKYIAETTNSKKPKLILKKRYQPKLYALIVGTSDYRGTALDLSFADKDATDISNALQLAGNELFGAKNTFVHLLNTESNSIEPTKNNIDSVFNALSAKVNADDIFLLYLSGHGVNYGSPNSQFYYLTKGVASEDIADKNIRDNYTVSSQEFTNYLKNIAANKQIMVLDACSSGSLVNNLLSQSRSLSSNQKRAFERMKDRTGVFILAGSAADKVSYEASAFGQGLLTYSLLSGMRGGALRENQFVDVMQLFQYSADKVPELAAVIGGVQRPVIAAPTSTNSFDIGQVTDSVRYKIPLEEVKPLIIRSNFQDESLYEDVLDLSDKMDGVLIELSSDKESSIIFLDVKKYPKAFSIKGRYAIADNGTITLKANIIQDKRSVGTVESSGSNADMLVSDILDKLAEVLNE